MNTFFSADPISLINADIDRLMRRIPALPAWAAHQICGWDWLGRNEHEASEAYLEDARAENEYAHSKEAHQDGKYTRER